MIFNSFTICGWFLWQETAILVYQLGILWNGGYLTFIMWQICFNDNKIFLPESWQCHLSLGLMLCTYHLNGSPREWSVLVHNAVDKMCTMTYPSVTKLMYNLWFGLTCGPPDEQKEMRTMTTGITLQSVTVDPDPPLGNCSDSQFR